MAIDPNLITTIRVDQLPNEPLTLTSEMAHTVGNELKKDTIQSLVDLVATAVGVSGGVGYIAISVTDGQQLPSVPTDPSFFLCGVGTFLNVNGYPDIVCTENLNAVMSLFDHWELAVEIPIAPLSGTVETVTGTLVDNSDLLNPIINKQNLKSVLLVGNREINDVSTLGDYTFVSTDKASLVLLGDIGSDVEIFLDDADFLEGDVLIVQNASEAKKVIFDAIGSGLGITPIIDTYSIGFLEKLIFTKVVGLASWTVEKVFNFENGGLTAECVFAFYAQDNTGFLGLRRIKNTTTTNFNDTDDFVRDDVGGFFCGNFISYTDALADTLPIFHTIHAVGENNSAYEAQMIYDTFAYASSIKIITTQIDAPSDLAYEFGGTITIKEHQMPI